MRILSAFLICLLCACTAPFPPPEDAPLNLKETGFDVLPGWERDNHTRALEAFKVSCRRIVRQAIDRPFGPVGGTYGDWRAVCQDALSLENATQEQARAFFESRFTPYQALAGKREEGLFTGYYEPSLDGALTRHGPYQTALRRKPDDLVMVDLGAFRDDLKGRRIAGRVTDGRLRPYEDRAAIAAGGHPQEQGLPIVWVDDPVDAFFLHIQGSGQVRLEDGRVLRLGYAGQNGHPYFAIGRELIRRGAMTKDTVSMQAIRKWLEQNPDQAADVMNMNASYVFFQVLDGPGPLGGEGLPLTPERSLAIDRSKIAYGIPVWTDIAPPKEGEKALQRLMIAQDTGGAIRGAVRGDVFWGAGARAEYLAGHMKSRGRYWLLLPTGLQL